MVGAILVSHENLSRSLVEAVAKITGESENIVPISSRGLSPAHLAEEVVSVIEAMKNVDRIILFTDLHGGTCSLVCGRIQRKFPEIPVITGVNLPLLIDFVFQRNDPPEDIIRRLVEKGRAGIQTYSGERGT